MFRGIEMNLLERVKERSKVLADAIWRSNSYFELESEELISVMRGCELMFDCNAAVIKRELGELDDDILYVYPSCYPCNGTVSVEREALKSFLENGSHKEVFDKLIGLLEEYNEYPLLDEDDYYENLLSSLIEETTDSIIEDGEATEDERETVREWLFENATEIYGFLDYSTDRFKAYLEGVRNEI